MITVLFLRYVSFCAGQGVSFSQASKLISLPAITCIQKILPPAPAHLCLYRPGSLPVSPLARLNPRVCRPFELRSFNPLSALPSVGQFSYVVCRSHHIRTSIVTSARPLMNTYEHQFADCRVRLCFLHRCFLYVHPTERPQLFPIPLRFFINLSYFFLPDYFFFFGQS